MKNIIHIKLQFMNSFLTFHLILNQWKLCLYDEKKIADIWNPDRHDMYTYHIFTW